MKISKLDKLHCIRLAESYGIPEADLAEALNMSPEELEEFKRRHRADIDELDPAERADAIRDALFEDEDE